MNETGAFFQPGATIKPIVNRDQVDEILKTHYGLKCVSIKKLNGYDDVNFLIQVDKTEDCSINAINEDGYVFKIINSFDSKNTEFFDAQTLLLLYLSNTKIVCPKPVPLKNGRYSTVCSFESGEHIVRMLEFIPGEILHRITPSTPTLYYKVGRSIAQIDAALTDFHHPAYERRRTIWMLNALPQVSEVLYVIDDALKKQQCERIIDEFVHTVVPVIDRLPRGLIHGDFNESNVLVELKNGEWDVKAVLDFGDSQVNCYLFEIALTMAYMILNAGSVGIGREVLSGYTSIRPLSQLELDLLKVCVCGRLVQSLVLGAYTATLDPGNSYILTTSTNGWRFLEELWVKSDLELLNEWGLVGTIQ